MIFYKTHLDLMEDASFLLVLVRYLEGFFVITSFCFFSWKYCYTLFNLVDINECDVGLHSCNGNAACANTDGSYTCSCNAGFSGDGSICTGMNDYNSCKGTKIFH